VRGYVGAQPPGVRCHGAAGKGVHRLPVVLLALCVCPAATNQKGPTANQKGPTSMGVEAAAQHGSTSAERQRQGGGTEHRASST
jgi:hypothetical protein